MLNSKSDLTFLPDENTESKVIDPGRADGGFGSVSFLIRDGLRTRHAKREYAKENENKKPGPDT